jgi:hypothetical protein
MVLVIIEPESPLHNSLQCQVQIAHKWTSSWSYGYVPCHGLYQAFLSGTGTPSCTVEAGVHQRCLRQAMVILLNNSRGAAENILSVLHAPLVSLATPGEGNNCLVASCAPLPNCMFPHGLLSFFFWMEQEGALYPNGSILACRTREL